jgi:hypothetical protein
MEHQTIIAASLIGSYGITLEDGDTVYSAIAPLLAEGDTIELDFKEISHFAAPFFNAAIGRLFDSFTADYLNTHLHMLNLSPAGRGTLSQVMKNAEAYYSDIAVRNAVDYVLDQQAMMA